MKRIRLKLERRIKSAQLILREQVPETKIGRGIWLIALILAVFGLLEVCLLPILIWRISTYAPELNYDFLDAVFGLGELSITAAGFLFAGYELWRTMKSLRKPRLRIKLVGRSLTPIPIAIEYHLLLESPLIRERERNQRWTASFKMFLDTLGDTTIRYIYVHIYPIVWKWISEDNLSKAECIFRIIRPGDYADLPKINADLPRGWRYTEDGVRISFTGGSDIVILPGVSLYMGEFMVEVNGKFGIGEKLLPPIHDNVLFIEVFADNAKSSQVTLLPNF